MKPVAAVLLATLGTLAAPSLTLAATGGASLSPGAAPIATTGSGSGSGSGTSSAGSGSGSGTSSAGSGSGSGTSTAGSGSGNPLVGDGEATVTAAGAGITVSSTASAVLRKQLQFSGTVPSSDSGATVEVERLGHQTGWTWAPTTHATVGPNGSFSAAWNTNHIGQFSIRVIVENAAAHVAAASPTLSVVVYRPSIASWFGPGLFGKGLACGGTLGRQTLGVANRTLPCGTKVALLYQGRTLTVPVIDRGPYANNADWDLTEATGKALGMTGVVTIGAASLPVKPGG